MTALKRAEVELQKTERDLRKALAEIKVLREILPSIKGWFEYFKHAHHYTFSSLDGFIRRRLRAVLRKQKKRPGSGKTDRDHRQWPNVFFAERGLFTMRNACVLARQHLCQDLEGENRFINIQA